MRIFVTGATGFIGSNFLNYALSEGHDIVALKRSKDSRTRIKLNVEPFWLVKELDQVVKEDLKDVDVVLHLAAHSMSPPYDTLENCLYWNLIAPVKLFKQAILAGIKSFVVAGSCFEYGKSGEDYDFIPITAPLRPTLTYAASKAASYLAFYQLAVENGVKLHYHRIFQVFGEGELETRLWPSLKKAALAGQDFPMTKGEQIRDFIEVRKVAEKLLESAELIIDREDFEPLINNLGSGKPQSILEFSKFWWEKWGAKGKLLIGEIPYREGEVMRYVPKLN